MVALFAAEVDSMLWILIGTSLLGSGPCWLSLVFSLLNILISATETFAEHVYITGYYYNEIDMCFGYITPAYEHIWIAWFAFEAILALLAVWAGVQQSRQQLMPG